MTVRQRAPIFKHIWLNGHTCLNCGKGWYDGYLGTMETTRPCNKCGHIAPAVMTKQQFYDAVAERDKRLEMETRLNGEEA